MTPNTVSPRRFGQQTSRAPIAWRRAWKPGINWVNCWFLRDLRTPFGGMGLSGFGREGGQHALNFYSEQKNICIKL
jgi:acyl-CoA reductase-like NAD-dependent aldehyde dehydrogenase